MGTFVGRLLLLLLAYVLGLILAWLWRGTPPRWLHGWMGRSEEAASDRRIAGAGAAETATGASSRASSSPAPHERSRASGAATERTVASGRGPGSTDSDRDWTPGTPNGHRDPDGSDGSDGTGSGEEARGTAVLGRDAGWSWERRRVDADAERDPGAEVSARSVDLRARSEGGSASSKVVGEASTGGSATHGEASASEATAKPSSKARDQGTSSATSPTDGETSRGAALRAAKPSPRAAGKDAATDVATGPAATERKASVDKGDDRSPRPATDPSPETPSSDGPTSRSPTAGLADTSSSERVAPEAGPTDGATDAGRPSAAGDSAAGDDRGADRAKTSRSGDEGARGSGASPASVAATPVDAPVSADIESGPGDPTRAASASGANSAPPTAVGAGDDLKRIRGIGPKNAERLNEAGITRFSQIAAWTPDDAREMGERLSFGGRIERENWIEQARTLSEGGDTDFSRRVDAGKVRTSLNPSDPRYSES